MRKNIHVPDLLAEMIGKYRHDTRFKTETAAIVDLLERTLNDIYDPVASYVYLGYSQKNDLYKIGFSSKPYDRVKDLSGAEHGKVKLYAVIKGGRVAERVAHILFDRYRVDGEWFQPDREISEYFREHGKAMQVVGPRLASRSENKEQWNHRIKVELADAMRVLQEKRNNMDGNEQSLRDLTEEAFVFFLHFNGVKIKDAA